VRSETGRDTAPNANGAEVAADAGSQATRETAPNANGTEVPADTGSQATRETMPNANGAEVPAEAGSAAGRETVRDASDAARRRVAGSPGAVNGAAGSAVGAGATARAEGAAAAPGDEDDVPLGPGWTVKLWNGQDAGSTQATRAGGARASGNIAAGDEAPVGTANANSWIPAYQPDTNAPRAVNGPNGSALPVLDNGGLTNEAPNPVPPVPVKNRRRAGEDGEASGPRPSPANGADVEPVDDIEVAQRVTRLAADRPDTLPDANTTLPRAERDEN
jgi:hypothetical protein